MAATVLEESSEVRIGHVGPLLVSVWYSQATLRGLEAHDRQHVALAREFGKITSLSVAVKIPRAPGPEAQEWLKRSAEALFGTSHGTVIVVLERGLGAILARSFIAAASLISANPIQVTRTIDDAVQRVKAFPEQHPTLISDAGLTATLEAFAALPAPKGD
ncbi:MAG: hypothetical protein ACO1OB_06780 [Archangium sp.]